MDRTHSPTTLTESDFRLIAFVESCYKAGVITHEQRAQLDGVTTRTDPATIVRVLVGASLPSENRYPYNPDYGFPVGEYIAELLDERGWSTRDCAERMGGDVDVDELTLDFHLAVLDAPIEHGIHTATMGQRTADGLARAFGTSAELWMNLDAAYHRWLAARNV